MATTWHVPADFDSVSTAIEAAFDGDTILIAPGNYPGVFSITKDLTITAGDADDGSVILEINSFWVGPPSLARLEGLTFSGENIPGQCAVTGNVRISDCGFENFQIVNTWGINLLYAEVEFHNCLVRNNHNETSMFWVGNGGQVEFHGCEFTDNSGMMGSAITLAGTSSLLIQECFFSQNHTTGRGGAVFGSSLIEIDSSRFEGNSSDSQGGAVYAEDCRITNCSFTGNSAAEGGALAIDQSGELYLENTDFSFNTASLAGPQGFMVSVSFVEMVCCLADLDLWSGNGQVTLDNEGCAVGTRQVTLEAFKAMYR